MAPDNASHIDNIGDKSMNITTIAIVAVILAFIAGAIMQRNQASKDIIRAARMAADQQAENTNNLYWALHVKNGVAFDEHHKLKPHQYPARKVKEAEAILRDFGLEESKK